MADPRTKRRNHLDAIASSDIAETFYIDIVRGSRRARVLCVAPNDFDWSDAEAIKQHIAGAADAFAKLHEDWQKPPQNRRQRRAVRHG